MPETPTQPNLGGDPKTAGGKPALKPQEDRSFADRPSDTEAAHNSEEGGALRDPRQQADVHMDQSVDASHGSLDGHPSKDLAGDAQVGERLGERGGRLER